MYVDLVHRSDKHFTRRQFPTRDTAGIKPQQPVHNIQDVEFTAHALCNMSTRYCLLLRFTI